MFDANDLAGIAGVILSLVFSYVPGAKDWFAKLDGTKKRLFMLGALLVSSLVVVGLVCSGFGQDFGLAVVCDRSGLVRVVSAFFFAAIANQTTYALSPKATPVIEEPEVE
jgi:hypothetical protein